MEISLIISKGDSGWLFAIISDDAFLFKKMAISNKRNNWYTENIWENEDRSGSKLLFVASLQIAFLKKKSLLINNKKYVQEKGACQATIIHWYFKTLRKKKKKGFHRTGIILF